MKDQVAEFDELVFNLEMILFSVYDEFGNDITRKYIDSVDEKEENDKKQDVDDNDNTEYEYKWDIDIDENSDEIIIKSPSYTLNEPDIELGFEIELDNAECNTEIHVHIKSMPENIKKISIMCRLYIE